MGQREIKNWPCKGKKDITEYNKINEQGIEEKKIKENRGRLKVQNFEFRIL